jgi:DNA polymerase III gamma/tau subunit
MEDALGVLGAVDRQLLARIIDALAEENTADALREAHVVLFGGTDCEDFADQLSEYLRDLVVAACCGPDDPMLAGAMADGETLARQAGLFSPEQITYMIQLLREAKLRARRDSTGRIALELALIKMSRLSDLVPVEAALEQLAGLPGPDPAPPRAAGQADPGSAAPANAAAAGRLRRMRESLKSGRKPGAAPAQSRTPPPPEGVDDVKYRQLNSVSADPELAREAMAQEPLRKAFAEADKALGLDPVRLERVQDDAKETDDESADAPAEDDGE